MDVRIIMIGSRMSISSLNSVYKIQILHVFLLIFTIL